MKVIYEKEIDVLRIILNDHPVHESDEQQPGVILDFDKQGQLVGMEILNASKNTNNPMTCEFAVA